jgi:transposase-like protein
MVSSSSKTTSSSTSERPTEVIPKASRRRFTAEYKRKVLAEADACEKTGDVGALLRREGLWSSHLSTWRAQRAAGELQGLTPRKRGRKAKPVNPLDDRVRELERENAKLRKRAERAEALVEVQKKLSELWGVDLPTPAPDHQRDDGRSS